MPGLSTHSEQPATNQPTETSIRSEAKKPPGHEKPTGVASNQTGQLSIGDG